MYFAYLINMSAPHFTMQSAKIHGQPNFIKLILMVWLVKGKTTFPYNRLHKPTRQDLNVQKKAVMC